MTDDRSSDDRSSDGRSSDGRSSDDPSTNGLSTATGVRQSVSVVLPVLLHGEPDWARGPLPFAVGERARDAEWRRQYFAPAVARALHGRRWHRTTTVTDGPLTLIGLELLGTARPAAPHRALGVLHFDVTGPALLEVLRAIGHRPGALPDPLTGPLSPATLFAAAADTTPPAEPFAIARPYTIAFFTPDDSHPSVLRRADGELPATAHTWLGALAARSAERDNPPTPQRRERLAQEAIRLSADWSALVGPHGTAFLGHRADRGDSDFYAFAQAHIRSVHLDTLLLGMIQRDHLNALGDQLSTVFDTGPGLARRLAALEDDIAVFRSAYWRPHQTVHGPAAGVLRAFHTQHRLPSLFTDILAEAADYGRLVQTRESQQIAGALGILTILGLPLGTALSILQVLGDGNPWHLLLALGLAFATTAAVLTTRYGRLVLASLRGRARG
ncbi:hypothetical protein ACFXAZ_19350 [Streptomyces sp. NPDC059477]|uniref:hypothetical protein n=1 Tax=Streptomyces sp. NPDC059477 TaxID=3346847 RepID=UPI0036C14C77